MGNPRRSGVSFQLKSSCAPQWERPPSPGMLRRGIFGSLADGIPTSSASLGSKPASLLLAPASTRRPRRPRLRSLHTSHHLPKRRLLPKRQRHNLQSHLVSHTCPFSFPIPSPQTSLDPCGAESQAAPTSMGSVPVTALGLLVSSVPPRRVGMGQEWGWVGWKSCPKSRRDLPSWRLALVGTQHLPRCSGTFGSTPSQHSPPNLQLNLKASCMQKTKIK